MDNLDYMKVFGEWLYSIAPNLVVKSLTHDSFRAMYECDYVIVTNLCNGFGKIPPVSLSTKVLDGAKERYKEFNKAVLEISTLSEEEKKKVSSQIDLNAEEQKNRWINMLKSNGIIIAK